MAQAQKLYRVSSSAEEAITNMPTPKGRAHRPKPQ